MSQQTFGAEEFTQAREGFIKNADLLGRLLLIFPTGKGSRQSTQPGAQPGQMYEFIEGDCHVLDGPPSDVIEQVPMLLEGQQFSGAGLVPQLSRNIGKGKPVLGRLGQRKSRWNTPSWVLVAPTQQDIAVAGQYMAHLRQQEMQAAAAADPWDNGQPAGAPMATDPFGGRYVPQPGQVAPQAPAPAPQPQYVAAPAPAAQQWQQPAPLQPQAPAQQFYGAQQPAQQQWPQQPAQQPQQAPGIDPFA